MKNLKEVKNSTFRPLTRLSLYLHRIRNRLFRVPRSFRPLTGLSLYLLNQIHPVIMDSINEFPSPHGVISISTSHESSDAHTRPPVSVPSRGYLYIYNLLISPVNRIRSVFPSPHGVISISTGIAAMSNQTIPVSVPSRGYLYIYAILMKGKMKTRFAVSVPSRGYLYIYS